MDSKTRKQLFDALLDFGFTTQGASYLVFGKRYDRKKADRELASRRKSKTKKLTRKSR